MQKELQALVAPAQKLVDAAEAAIAPAEAEWEKLIAKDANGNAASDDLTVEALDRRRLAVDALIAVAHHRRQCVNLLADATTHAEFAER